MGKCCVEAERCFDNRRAFNDMKNFTPSPVPTNEAIAAAACQTVLDLNIDLIVVITDSGLMARMVSKYRPPVPVLACSTNMSVIK